ncbi:MAG TPA: transposase [Caulobacter sp.]|nr:transposase [Caulobacter sp.]
MPRQARVVVPGCPHHVVQRGNRKQRTFFEDGDYRAYLRIAAEEFAAAGVEAWAYCLMPNHVHLIATPATPEGLAQAVATTHLRYTRRVNAREDWTGYLWQGRFASFPMDEGYLLRCARYVALNPVRAGLSARAVDWPWSNVGPHLGRGSCPLLTREPLVQRLGDGMAAFFDADIDDEARARLRRACSTGRPVGDIAWVKALEARTGRSLVDPPMGRPRRGESRDTHHFPK